MKINFKKIHKLFFLVSLMVVLLANVSLTFAADTTQPQVNITSPTTNSHHGQWIGIQISASDDVAVTKVEIYIDGRLKTTLTQAPYNWTWDNFYELDPMHHISARAYDAAGNVGYSNVVSVIIDDAIAAFSHPEQPRVKYNLALNKSTTASKAPLSAKPAAYAFDGDINTSWSSDDSAPQWVQVDLGGRNLIDSIELVVGQYPAEGYARHEVYGIGKGGDEGLLFVIESKLTDGQTITHQFIPALRNISKIKVLTANSQSYVAWKEIRVFGTPLTASYSTNISNINSTAYYPYSELATGFQNLDFNNFITMADKLKALGLNSMWLIIRWTDFENGPPFTANYNEQAFAKLTSMIDALKTRGMNAILPLNYGGYFDTAIFSNRNVWKAYQRFVADFSYRYRDYNNIIFANFTEGSYPSTQVGQVNQRGLIQDEIFRQWAYSINPDVSYWNSRWGTSYTWNSLQADRYPSSDVVNGQFTVTGKMKCEDDFRWINSRLRQSFGRLSAIQSIYGNPSAPYAYHDYVTVEGWTANDSPIPKPNLFDIVSYGFYPATQADCGLNNVKVATSYDQWVSLSDFYVKMSRLSLQFPNTQVLIGEIGSPSALSGEDVQAKLVTDYISNIKSKLWGFNFWNDMDYQTNDPAQRLEKTHGLFRSDGSPKPAATAMANLLGGTTSTPTLSPSPSPPSTTTSISVSVKLINDSGTFYLIQNGQRQGITNPDMLYTYGFEFKDALLATTADLNLPAGSLLLPNNGSLVKSPLDSTVYLVSSNQKHGFTSVQVFSNLGFRFTSVLTVTAPELDQLPLGNVLDDSTISHPDGLNINQDGTIYFLQNQIKHGYPSLQVYNSWNLDNDFSKVVPANAADRNLPVGEMVGMRVVK